MKYLISLILLLAICLGATAQEIKSYSFAELDTKLAEASRNQVVIVNFWATWCKPCIKELPYFESLKGDFNNNKLKVMLVSLDMEKERAVNYAQKKNLQSEVLYLDEVDFNQWIDRISPEWSGAIPATLMLGPDGKRSFFEGSFEQEELVATVKRFIQNNQ